MPKIAIKKIWARQILDSRGEPTLEVTVKAGNTEAAFGVPSGTSVGRAEAVELRDGGAEFFGKGVSKAVYHVNEIIAKSLKGFDVQKQQKIDELLIELDGTPNKSRLGANAILGVSGACSRAAAMNQAIPLYQYLANLHGWDLRKLHQLPKPMFNVINGGAHADTNLDIQEFMLVPTSRTILGAVRTTAEIFHQLKKVLKHHRLDTDLGNEGGFSPNWESNKQPLDLIAEAVSQRGLTLKKDVNIALDVAASGLYQPKDNEYLLTADHVSLSSERLASLYKEWASRYSVISVEDGLGEEDWGGWLNMTERLGHQMMLVGDDLFTTNEQRIKKGIEMKVANAVLIKPNQIGTVTETLRAVKLAQKHNYKVIASHRSGETNDDFIADLAVGIGANFIKAGSVARGERVAKYNRLLKIEEELE